MASCIQPSKQELQEQSTQKRKNVPQIFKAAISLILCTAMIVAIIPPQAVWAVTDALSKEAVVLKDTVYRDSLYDSAIDIQSISDDKIVGEISGLRDNNTKHFRLSDGTTLAAIYDAPIHKQDASGAWQDIDYRLTDNGDEYENNYGTIQVKFSKNPKNGKLYTLKTDNGQFKWSLSGVKENVKDATHTESESQSNKLSINNASGIITYNNILPGTTLQYWITENKIKENIIFSDKDSAGPLKFNLDTNKFDLVLEENKINFYNEDSEIELVLSAPWMMDNKGIISDAITLSLSGSKNHYEVTITPDAEWLQTASYPVTIDPVIGKILQSTNSSETNKIDSIYVYSARPDESQTLNYGGITVGRESSTYGNCRGAIKFELPDDVTTSDRVIAASLQLTTRLFEPEQSNLTVTVNAHQITRNIGISGLTWNTLNGNYSPIISDSQVISLEHDQNYTRIPFDITNMVRDWYRKGNNYGLALVSDNENGAYKYVSMYTSSFPDYPSRWPTLIIQYANTNGIEDNLTYHTVGNSEMGVASVNDFNGNMVYSFDDVTTTGSLFPVKVSHVFDNSYRINWQYYQGGCYVGMGFRLNLYERIVDCDIEGYPYMYLDADGTWHYFKVKDQDQNLYVDEFHPNRVLKRVNNSAGNPSYFHLTDGSNIETRFTFNGYPWYKIDVTNNKKAEVEYIGSTAIVDTITDGAGRITKFDYTISSGRRYLTSVTDPAGRKTTYTYSGNSLTSITRPGNRTITFTYDSNSCLTQIKNYDNSYIKISYYSDTYNGTKSLFKVKTLEEHGMNLGEMKIKYTFSYGNGETTVTDHRDRSETLMFDDFGQTVSVRDNLGRGIFLKYNSPNIELDVNPNRSNNTDTDKSRTGQLDYTTKMQTSIINYAKNSGFENSSLSPWQAQDTTQSGSAVLTSEQKYTGDKSLKMQSTASTGRYGYRQLIDSADVSSGKTYTISAYVKIANITPTLAAQTCGALVYFEYETVLGDTGRTLGETLYTVDDEWVRLSCSITLGSNVTALYAVLGIYNARGTVYFDNVQVEEDSAANSYNLVDNSNFNDAVGTSMPSSYYGYGLNATNDKIVTMNGRNCFKIVGARSSYKNIEQDINVSGNAGDRYTFSAWAKSTGALSQRGSLTSEERDFDIRITFVNTDDTVTKKYFEFEDKTTSWQLLSGEAIANKDYSSVKIAFLYNNQKNDAYVDDICLFKEGGNIRYSYDDWGRVTKVWDIADDGDKKTAYTYEVAYTEDASVIPDNRIRSISYPDGTSESYTYDSSKRLKTHTDTDGVTTTYNYDANGNLLDAVATQGTDANSNSLVGNATSYTNSGNYAYKVTDPFGNSTASVIDENTGLVSSITDAKNNTTNYTYNQNTEELTKVEMGREKINYTYSNGLLTSLQRTSVFSDDVVFDFTYDSLYRLRNVSIGEISLVTHKYYYQTNNLEYSLYGNGFKVDYSYDDLDRLTKICYNTTNEKYNWAYDSVGRVALHNDLENDQQFRYTYDSKGRVDRVSSIPTENGFSRSAFSNTFNANNQLTSVKRTVGSTTLETNYIYSSSGRLTKEEFDNGSNLNYSYDNLGRLSSKALKNSSNSNVFTRSYLYDAGATQGTTTARVNTETISGNGWSDAYVYTYDKNGNVSKITKNNTVVAEYRYDGLNQLTFAHVDGKYYNYEYGFGGSIVSKNADEEYVEYTYIHDEWTDILTHYNNEPITYDEMGNPIDYLGGKTFSWNGRRLATVSVNGNNLSFNYNSDGIRTKKTVNGTTTYFTLDGSKIISQKTGDSEIFFEYDAAGNVTTMIYGGQTYYYLRNMLGEIIGLADNNGNKVVSYAYDPFGVILSTTDTSSNNIGSLNPFKYKGYYYDSETKLYYVNSRYYDPEICRWISADGQMSGIGGDIVGYNLFAYCGNNPVNRIDPTGEAWWHWALGAAIVAVAAVATVVTCGGFAAAATAVCMVGSGVAAATTASTVAAGAFIGSATVYGMAVLSAASTSSSVQEFNHQGNWGTVAATAFGGLTGGYDGYTMSKAQATQTVADDELFLPDSFYSKHAPKQSAPNSSYTNYTYNNHIGKYEKSTAYYDFAGRQTIRIDWTNHGYSNHGNPHVHYTTYNSQYRDGFTIRWD